MADIWWGITVVDRVLTTGLSDERDLIITLVERVPTAGWLEE